MTVAPEPEVKPEAEDQPEAAEPERPPVELVEAPTAATELALRGQDSALERAAEAALAMPGLPGRDEFLMLAVQARMLSMSQGAPKEVRNNPHLAFHVAMIGRDLGISPSAALQQVDVIGEGEDAQLSLSPELLNGQVRRLGLGSIVPGFRSYERAVAVALMPGGELDPRCGITLPDTHWFNVETDERCRCRGVLGATDFTWVDAKVAGLVTWDCASATDHSMDCRNRVRHKNCRQGWRTYPKRMLWWRAAGYCSADFFPEASIGLYSPEELGAVVDAEGRPIDPATIELPEGYEPAVRPPSAGEQLWSESDPDGFADAARRIARIAGIDAASDALKALWTPADGDAKAPPFRHCQRRHAATVKALIRAIEARGEKGDFGDWPELGGGEPAQEPAPEGDAPTGATAEPEPDVETGPECDACGAKPGADHDPRLHELTDAVDAARAATEAAQEPPATDAATADPEPEAPAACPTCGAAPDGDHDRTKHDVALASEVVTEVAAMDRIDVVAQLGELGYKVTRGEQNQRRDLATVLYLQRGGTPDPHRPGPDRREDAPAAEAEPEHREQPELA